jgi:hypothetical protein
VAQVLSRRLGRGIRYLASVFAAGLRASNLLAPNVSAGGKTGGWDEPQQRMALEGENCAAGVSILAQNATPLPGGTHEGVRRSGDWVLARESLERGGGLGIAVEHKLACRGRIEPCWFGLLEKGLQRVGEPERVIEVRKVASFVE